MEDHLDITTSGILLATGVLAAAAGGYAVVKRRRPVILPLEVDAKKRPDHRLIALRGANNLRDLGGYRTENGQSVRWGALYRSDRLSKLTDRDLDNLKRLNLVAVIDFRSVFERERAPDRLPAGHAIKVVELPVLDDANDKLGKELRDKLQSGQVADIDPMALMTQANDQFVTRFTPQYRRFFQELLSAGGAPVLFHCTGGKDRAGFAAALTLRVLGVPEDTVFEDYQATNMYALPRLRRTLFLIFLSRGRQTARVAKQLFTAHPAFLRAAFDAINREYGSFDAYVRDGLLLNAQDISQLQAYLLEDAAPQS